MYSDSSSMLNKTSIIDAKTLPRSSFRGMNVKSSINDKLVMHGYCLLRNFSVDRELFDQLVNYMCSTVTFDPTTHKLNKSLQKVNAGTEKIGLHVENGNTPSIPELVFFYCQQAAQHGSCTTLCDGAQLLALLPDNLQALFEQPLTVTSTLPEVLWKSYLVSEHPMLTEVEQVKHHHLEETLAARPELTGSVSSDNSLAYRLTLNPLISSKLGERPAFANAILGPSFNEDAPAYEFADGTTVSDELKHELAELAESITVEIPWQVGDIAIIDNWRVMHGRRQAMGPENRKLFMGMGNL